MDEEIKPLRRLPVNKGRYIPYNRTPSMEDIRMETEVHDKIHHLNDGHPVAAIQLAKSLAASAKAHAPSAKPKHFNRPAVNPSRARSVSVSRLPSFKPAPK
jgi:hypothetical protein